MTDILYYVIPAKAGIAVLRVGRSQMANPIAACAGMAKRGKGGVERGGYTYILTNKPRSVLYIGVTSDVAARMMQHREGRGSAFARRYGLDRLVLIEQHDTIEEAIAREKALKAWQRAWKIELIERGNPSWGDLWDTALD